jgi:adenylate cyclase
LHRKKAELLLVGSEADAAEAEQEFNRAIDIARRQAAKLFELRAVTSLARLWSSQGRRHTALELVRSTCQQFGEATDIIDVREANALLVDLELGLSGS